MRRIRRINLQLFAEDAEPTPTDETKNLSAEELKVQLAQANAKIAKLTNKADALATENATKTKQLRQYMSEEELKAAEKKEAEVERDRQFETMRRKIAVMTSVNTYMDVLEMPKDTAMQYAEARADGDTEKEKKILRQHMQTFKASLMQDFLRSRPDINAGHGENHESKAVEIARSLPNYNVGVDEEILKRYM